MKDIKKVAILGAGAMGAAYAAKFVDASGFETQLVARPPRYDLLKANGLIVNGKHYSVPVVHPEEADSPADLIIVALKSHHLPEAGGDLRNVVGDDTTIISVMNGIESEEYLGALYGMQKTLYAIALGIDAVRDGNSVVYTNPGKIYFGEADNSSPSERVRNVRNALDRAGFVSDAPADMIRMLWWKFMINVGINQASAIMRAPYGVFQTSPDARSVMEILMREVLLLAGLAGVDLREKDLEDWLGVLKTLSPVGKTSMLQDIEAGRKTEVEVFAGKVVSLAETYGVSTPANLLALNVIHVLEQTGGKSS